MLGTTLQPWSHLPAGISVSPRLCPLKPGLDSPRSRLASSPSKWRRAFLDVSEPDLGWRLALVVWGPFVVFEVLMLLFCALFPAHSGFDWGALKLL